MPSLSTAKLVGFGLAAAAILSFALLAFHWRDTMTSRGKQLDAICAATRAAADNQKLDCKLVAQQIGQFGQSIANLKQGIANQNAAVNALAAQTKDAQAKAAQASQEAAQRAKGASSVSQSLSASARAPERSSAPCVASDKLKEQWR